MAGPDGETDLCDLLGQFTNYVQNERNRSYNEGVDTERARCAEIAEHLSGWGNAATQQSGLAEHIAKIIRARG